MIVGNARGAGFGIQTIRERFPQCLDAASGTIPRFEDGDVVTELRQFIASRQSRHAGANDDDLLGSDAGERERVRP